MKLVLSIVGILFSITALAETTNGGYTGCTTKAYYDEMIQMVSREDKRGFEYLIKKNYCFVIPANLQMSVLDRGFLSSKIRLYAGDTSAILFVPSEMIK